MGSHYYADGAMHEEVERIGGNVTHLDAHVELRRRRAPPATRSAHAPRR